MIRVVITGIGLITPIGNSIDAVEKNLYNGNSGFKWVEEHATVHGVIDSNINDYFTNVENNSTDRYTKLSWISYLAAKEDARLIPEGVFYGVGFGGGATTVEECYNNIFNNKKVSPTALIRSMPCAGASFIASKDNITGPVITYTTACSSSTIALGEAYEKILNGSLISAAVVGSESINTTLNARWWRAIGAINEDKNQIKHSLRPFSSDRRGTVISEGSVTMILESLESAIHRGAKIYGEIVGYGISTGTETYTKPSMDAQVKVIESAIRNINIADITYINAHATGTPVGDIVELHSLKKVFDTRIHNIPISSTKSITGHMLGAAGVMETLSCLIVLKNNKVIPNHFIKEKDKEIPEGIFLPTEIFDYDMDVALNNSFAFGGSNAVIAIKKWK